VRPWELCDGLYARFAGTGASTIAGNDIEFQQQRERKQQRSV
jgi:hypothetical protein